MSGPAQTEELPTLIAASSTARAQWLAPALLLAFWAYAVYRLDPLWQASAAYQYGCFVPILCLALFWEGWPSRPMPTAPQSKPAALFLFAAGNSSLALGAFLLEVWPDWRLAGWLFAAAVVGLTLLAVYFQGGRGWVSHFAFPVLFFLVAVPWPARFEGPLLYQLSHLNAALSVETANVLGTPCIRQGTLIQTAGGLVGVEDACSGIRSLQSTIMVALFLGESFRYNLIRRVAMLGVGLGLAFAFNVVRTVYLVWVSAQQGNAGVDRQHDEAGYTILGATLVGLLGLAWVLKPSRNTTAKQATTASSTPVAAANVGHYALPLLGGCLLWVALFESGMEWWFRSGEQAASLAAPWTFALPTQQPQFTEKMIPERTRNILRYDEGHNVAWQDAAGRQWELYYLRWLPATNSYRATETTSGARSHAPENCLKYAGMILQTNLGTKILNAHGIRLRATTQRFLDHQRSFHVLAAYWEPHDTACEAELQGDASTALAFRLVLQAFRDNDRGRYEKRVIKIMVWDMPDDEAAQTALEACLRDAIKDQGLGR